MTHDALIESSFLENEFQVVCSCGYRGTIAHTEMTALHELRQHLELVEDIYVKKENSSIA